MTLRAGVARRDVSNRTPLFLVGYPHVPRLSTGIHDPLWATALYLGEADQAVLSIAVDILFIHHGTAHSCRAAISRQTGLRPGQILISATHTHSGPITATMLSWREDPTVPAPDPEYMAWFERGIIEAGCAAVESAGPAELAVTRAQSAGVGGNRLSPDGPRDPEVGLLMVRRATDHTALALQMVYSMHPTVLHEDSRLVSSDFPHYTRLVLETAFPGLHVLYHNGPSGNLSPRYHVQGQTFAEAERLGSLLGRQVSAAVAQLRDADFRTAVPLGAATSRVELPPRRFGSVAEAEAELEVAIAEVERLRQARAAHGPRRTAECTVFGAEERLALARAQQSGATTELQHDYNPVEVQVLRIGNTSLVGWPGECFVEYALQLKNAVPGAFVVSLANGELQGYIPTPEATGYEARLSLFEPQSGDRLVAATVELVRRLQAHAS